MTEPAVDPNREHSSLAAAVDWREARTWWVFGLFAVGLGATSGVIIVATEVIGAILIAPEVTTFNLIAQMISVGFHCGVVYLLAWMIPLRSADGAVLRELRILYDPPEKNLKGFWPFVAWVGTISAVAVLVVLGQPFFELPGSVSTQTWLPVVFGMTGAQFPARALVAKPRKSEDRPAHE